MKGISREENKRIVAVDKKRIADIREEILYLIGDYLYKAESIRRVHNIFFLVDNLQDFDCWQTTTALYNLLVDLRYDLLLEREVDE